jgi:hypothetical protein
MRKPILFLAGGAALFLFACLVAPDEPGGTTQNALSCSAGQRAFNGACRKECTASSVCGAGESCMSVGPNVALCLEYKHCAYLGSDTQCSSSTDGYIAFSAYSPYNPYTPYNPYGYGPYDPYSGWDFGYGSYSGSGYGGSPNGCVGNATWQTLTPSGDPQCGAVHAVQRCAPVAGHCAFVSGATTDVADP